MVKKECKSNEAPIIHLTDEVNKGLSRVDATVLKMMASVGMIILESGSDKSSQTKKPPK